MAVKLSDLTTEGSPQSTDIIPIADPVTGVMRKITVSAFKALLDSLGGGGDAVAPTVVSMVANTASTVLVTFNESVTATTAGWSFKRNGSNWAVSSVSGSGTAWTFTMGTSALASDTIVGSYSSSTGGTVDTSNNELATFTDVAVSNGIGLIQLSTPGSFTATAASDTQINLVWGDVANESSYQIQRSTDNVTWTTINSPAANATSYNNTGLTASTLYYLRIKAVGDGVTYSDSNWATASATTSAGFEAVVWTNATANITIGSNGAIDADTTSESIGARATKKLTGSFIVEAQCRADYLDSELAWIVLSSVNNTVFDNGNGSNTGVIASFTTYQQDLYKNPGPDTTNANQSVIGTDIIANNMWVRIERSGDDLLYYTSPDGSAYTLRNTSTGAFTGLSECFIKFINGGGTGGYQAVRAQGLTTI